MSAQNAEHHGVFIASLGDEKMPTRSILVAIATPTAIQNIICNMCNLLQDKFINKRKDKEFILEFLNKLYANLSIHVYSGV